MNKIFAIYAIFANDKKYYRFRDHCLYTGK